ncbi:glutamate-cysteine ligase family protein [Rhizocola hellebori]|uniref:glutamate-cysteine ligase family protein n=1 Tax=Rhizocola hellebori TaxID=1392758 RepID=UPI0019412EA4|nr:glutamate-cysteine ligase family protein [Rhizocola hellebori]
MKLNKIFCGSPGPGRIGTEVELAPLDPVTGQVIGYGGARGLAAFLTLCAGEFDAKPLVERDSMVGLALPDGSKISLENGGAVEFSSPPMPRLSELTSLLGDALKRLAAIADELGFALVPGANLPFTKIQDIFWVPNARGQILREHFAHQGPQSAYGPEVMALTTSTQATFDYDSPDDLMDKVRALSAVSTIAAALFVNSPLAGGKPTGYLSERMRYWAAIDPERTGPLPAGLDPHSTLDDLIAWAVKVPMLYSKSPDGHAQSVHRPFSELAGQASEEDWFAHLSQIWTDVRVRQTIEARSLDGPPAGAIAAVPAFWTGLVYSTQARLAARELAGPATIADHRAAWKDIARRGLEAHWLGHPIRPIATELLTIAETGLREVEPDALPLLEPLREILQSGQTFAERTLAHWHGDPASYIATARLH